jgi:aldehyde dehydrogenase (NAD+)
VNAQSILSELGIAHLTDEGELAVNSPITGERVGRVKVNTVSDVDAALAAAKTAYKTSIARKPPARK